MIEARNERWKPGDPARLTTRLHFNVGDEGRPMPDDSPLPRGTLVRVIEVREVPRGRFRDVRIKVDRRHGGEVPRWAWLDPDCIARPEGFDAD